MILARLDDSHTLAALYPGERDPDSPALFESKAYLMSHKHAAIISVALLATLCLFRTFVTGWGPPGAMPSSVWAQIGVVDFPADNLSYVSWAQQTMRGEWHLSNLYTTTPHVAALFNLLFIVVGQASSIFGVHPILVMNVMGALALPVFVFGFNAACRALGVGPAASFAATCLAVGGGGISWVRRLIIWSGVDRILPVGQPGPDFSYFDLYPASTYFIYPSHAISLAILAILTFAIVRCDDTQIRLTAGRIGLLLALAFVLAWVRPYEPVTLLTAMIAIVVASIVLRLPSSVVRRRAILLACLAVAMLPQIIYGLWLSSLPVWGESTKTSFDFVVEGDWASGYFVLWLLAAIGAAALGNRVLNSAYAFPAVWALICAAIMLVLDSGVWLSKFAAGGTIALGLLAGAAIDWLAASLPSRRVAMAACAGVVGLAFASPVLVVLKYALNADPVMVRSELLHAIEAIRADSESATPTVLTDCGTGVMLPGLGGVRVYCGHWALTDHNRHKIMLLKSQLGFRSPAEPEVSYPGVTTQDIDNRAQELTVQIAGGVFEYAIVQVPYYLAGELSSNAGECTIMSGETYLVLRMCPAVVSVIQAKLN